LLLQALCSSDRLPKIGKAKANAASLRLTSVRAPSFYFLSNRLWFPVEEK
jgi:hypothetical protein